MQITTTVHVNAKTRAFGSILTATSGDRFMCLTIGEEEYAGTRVELLISAPEFLDFLANEAERLCREFVGEVPAPSQAHLDEKGERQTAEVAG